MGNGVKERALFVVYKGRKIRGLDGIKELVDELPRRLRGKALDVAAKAYLKYFKLYPRYKYVSRAKAYGSTGAKFENGNPVPDGYFSANQFRFVMAAIADGRIKPGSPHRTQDLKRAWRIEGKGTATVIVNDAPAAVFAFHPEFQSRQLAAVGWQDIVTMEEEVRPDVILELEVFIYNEAQKDIDRILLKK